MKKYVVFDLDDTLVSEMGFLKSAYREIAYLPDSGDPEEHYKEMMNLYRRGEDVFGLMATRFPEYTKDELIERYRLHFPQLDLNPGAAEILDWCRDKSHKLGLITDGRSVTQRNKLKALGIETRFDKILISEEFGSEKPDERNYTAFTEEGEWAYYYIGDNPAKDFITPNRLGWISVCLLNSGGNIHPQNFDVPAEYLPQIKIETLFELEHIIAS